MFAPRQQLSAQYLVFGRFSVLIIAVLVGLCGDCFGQPNETPQPTSKNTATTTGDEAARVRRLIEQLDAPKLADRTQAEEDLNKLGPGILPLLPPTDLLPSLGSKQAVQRVRIRLEHEAARLSIAASRLTATGQYSVLALARLIEQQTGNRITLSKAISERTETLKVDWQARTFWDAIVDLKQSGIELTFVADRGEFEFAPARKPASAGQATVQDALRLQAGPVTTMPVGKDQRLYRCPITLTAEPRLRPLFLRFAARDFVLSAADSTGWGPFDPEAKVEIPLGDGGREAQVELKFQGPLQVPPSVVLNGEARLLVAAAEQPIEFSKWQTARGVARRRGGVTVALANVIVKPAGNGRSSAVLEAHVSYDAQVQAFESHQTWIFHNKVYLLAPDGTRLAPNDGMESLFQNQGSVGVEYRFKDLPVAAGDWKFVYLAPTLLIEVPVKLNDLRVHLSTPD